MKSTDLPPLHTFSGILVLMLSLGLSACVGLPKIADTTTPWTDLSITREFSVEIDVPADKFTVTNLSIYFSRHFWPGESTANSDSVTGTGNTGSASFAHPGPILFRLATPYSTDGSRLCWAPAPAPHPSPSRRP